MKRFLHFSVFIMLIVTVFPFETFAQGEFINSAIDVVVNSYGRIRLYDLATEQVKHIERITPLIGGATDQVFDYQNDVDAEVTPYLVDAPTLSTYEITGALNNYYSYAPPDYRVDLNVYGWDEVPYFIVKYTVTNNEQAELNAYLGFEFIHSLDGTYGGEIVTFNTDNQAVLVSRDGTDTKLGIKILSHDFTTVKSVEYVDEYWLDEAQLYGWLTAGTIDETYVSTAGPLTVIGCGTATLAPAASTSFYFAVAFAASADAIYTALTDAETMYGSITSVEEIAGVPTEYNLSQNYPNPFNPSTKINFSVPANEFVTLKVYDVLGREVANLVNEELSIGNYSVDFNAGNLASGIYMYKLSSGNFTITKKMMLVK